MKLESFFFSTISFGLIDWFCILWKYIFYVIMIMVTFQSYIENHYIGPLHSCVLAKICNHTGIRTCGFEKNHQVNRLFLDDCDMFEYNCDNRKAYSKVDEKLCPQNTTANEDKDRSMTTTSVSHIISEATKETKKEITSKITTTEIVNSTDKKITRNPIAYKCTRSTKTDSSTAIIVTKDTATGSAQRCTCMETIIITTYNPSSMLPTYSEAETPTLPITTTTQTRSAKTLSTSERRCTCDKSPDNSYTKPMTTITMTTPLKTTIKTSSTRSASPEKCTCMEKHTVFTTTRKSTPETITNTRSSSTDTTIASSLTIGSSSEPGCTCTHPPSTPSIDKTSSEIIVTTVDYEEVIEPTADNDSCKKYPKHCKRPQTWETTVRGETRDFFQILREKFGDRVRILKDTTHWPRRTVNVANYNAFHYGNRHDT